MAKRSKMKLPDKPEVADSILNNVMFFAPFYERIVDHYSADLYIKGKMNVRKRNHLIKIVPSMFKLEKNVREYIIESLNDIHYTAPNSYDLKVRAVSGTIPVQKGPSGSMSDYFNMNVYSSTLLSDKLLSPLAKNAKKHYYYLLDSVTGPVDDLRYKILIIPRNKSSQLVSGYMVVSDQLWSLREIYLEGVLEFVRFKIKVEMGEKGNEEFLPKKFDVDIFFNFVGNKIDGSYSAYFKYNDIVLSDIKKRIERKRSKYDLTEQFVLTTDSSTYFTDTAHFARIRPIPLNGQEQNIYRNYVLRHDTIKANRIPKTRSQVFFGQVGEVLLSNYTVDMARFGSVRCSPLINPLLVSYSKNNGFSYRQEFKYNRLFAGDRLLKVVPRIGYNFTRKEFYWRIRSDFDYLPKKRASIHIDVGNGNRIYSSDVLDDIKSTADSVFDFEKLHLDYFKDLYFTFTHDIEVINGLTVSVGFTTHRRTPVEKPDFVSILASTPGEFHTLNNVRSAYISFAPRARISWTPGLYYYMSGNRKVNLRSDYPTFTLDWERGIKGVFKSTGEYERLEFDMQHQIRLGLMRNIYYRVGLGGFTNQKQMFFVDFVNFARSNLPVGWNDDIGGTFQLLDARWFNSSDRYLRGHFTFESPFLFWPHLIKYTNLIQNERLYLNVLFEPHLNPFLEFGYGIGTHIFDVGLFVSWQNNHFGEFGFKFTFELFNK